MAYPPPYIVQAAFLAPTSRIRRRVELYENDGVTPWKPTLWDRLVDGTVAADSSRDERRTVEVTLDNYDRALEHAPANLWYDKVLKLFYGVEVNELPRPPSIVIMEEYGASVVNQSVHLKRALAAQGYTQVRINPNVTTYAQISGYDIVISISEDYSRKLSLLATAFNAGKSVMTCNLTSTAAQLPYIISAAAGSTTAVAGTSSITRNTAVAHPLNTGWNGWNSLPAKTYRKITDLVSGAQYIGHWWDSANGTSIGAAGRESPAGPRWVHLQQAIFDPATMEFPTELEAFLGRAVAWMDVYEPTGYWEAQIGEFLVDSISSDETGDLIAIQGRDYAKRCKMSKFVNATGYATGSNIGTVIRGIAANAGITKFNFPPVTATLPRDLVYERGTERWKAMRDIADAAGHELFFDARGFLVLRPYSDPLLTPPSLVLNTGTYGNLVSATNRASDARLFNHVVVVGESSDSNIPPVAAEAKNIQATSPSSIQRIGDRVMEVKSSLVTTVGQAQTLANNYLRVASLEEFELNFSSILLPWVEPGEIVEIEEERSGQYLPTRYLLSSISLPLDLGPMSGNGKRVTIVL